MARASLPQPFQGERQSEASQHHGFPTAAALRTYTYVHARAHTLAYQEAENLRLTLSPVIALISASMTEPLIAGSFRVVLFLWRAAL